MFLRSTRQYCCHPCMLPKNLPNALHQRGSEVHFEVRPLSPRTEQRLCKALHIYEKPRDLSDYNRFCPRWARVVPLAGTTPGHSDVEVSEIKGVMKKLRSPPTFDDARLLKQAKLAWCKRSDSTASRPATEEQGKRSTPLAWTDLGQGSKIGFWPRAVDKDTHNNLFQA
jgi:hypothetical protein